MLPSSGHQPCVPLQPREGLRQPRGVAGRRGPAGLGSIGTAAGSDIEALITNVKITQHCRPRRQAGQKAGRQNLTDCSSETGKNWLVRCLGCVGLAGSHGGFWKKVGLRISVGFHLMRSLDSVSSGRE